MSNQIVSRRGLNAFNTVLRTDMELFFEANANLWHKKKNPEGKFPLNLAENNLIWPLVHKKIAHILSTQEIPDWVSNYTGLGGSDSFLESVADFMRKNITGTDIKKEQLAASAGSTAVIELCAWALCDHDDVALIPAPSYPVYTQDIKNKAAVERYDLSLSSNSTLGNITIDDLENATKEINRKGKSLKLIILTAPDNPTGLIYTQAQLNKIANWCIVNRIHLLVNELYSLSTIDIDHKDISGDYNSKEEITSFGKLIHEKRSNYLHMIYGLSKDFGVSGMRVGFIHSLNETFLGAYRNLNAPHMVSNMVQWIFQEFLKDRKFIKRFKKENTFNLTKSYVTVVKSLKKLNVPYVPARGSLFVWLDLSEFLTENTEEQEQELWEDIYAKTGVLLTPGTGFGNTKKGQFRLVHSFLNPKLLKVAMKKLSGYIILKRETSEANSIQINA